MTPSLAVSFVVDAHPKFRLQGLNLVATLLDAAVPSGSIVAHLVGDHPPAFLDTLAALGVRIVPVRPYGSALSPYCNKLVQLRSKALTRADQVVLLDADVAVAGDLSPALSGSGVRGKTVDTAAPPLPLLLALLKRAGLPRDAATTTTDFGLGDTLVGNLNGGVCMLSRQALERVGPYWLKWTHFTLGQADLLGPYAKHADQVGLALALIELGLTPTLLGLEMNFPTHLKKTSYRPEHDLAPTIVHYHDRLDDDGLLAPLGLPRVDGAVAAINAVLRRFHAEFPTGELLDAWRRCRA